MKFESYIKKIVYAFFLEPGTQGLCSALECVSENCVLGGLGERLFLVGDKAIINVLCTQKQCIEGLNFRLDDEWYQLGRESETTRMVYGSVHACGEAQKDETRADATLDIWLAFSALFEKQGDWRLVHIHLSVPYGEGQLKDYFSGTLTNRLREAEDLVDHMRQLATQDPVTSLYNHRAFFEMAEQMADCEDWYLMVLDLNQFKAINDTYGHLTGDDVLKRTGEVLRAATRKKDIVGRVGGDEFAVLCVDVQTDEMAMAIARRMVHDVNLLAGAQNSITVNVSVGVAKHHAANTVRQTFQRADTAMYQIKRNQENGCQLYVES